MADEYAGRNLCAGCRPRNIVNEQGNKIMLCVMNNLVWHEFRIDQGVR
jgi:hypothetical protein